MRYTKTIYTCAAEEIRQNILHSNKTDLFQQNGISHNKVRVMIICFVIFLKINNRTSQTVTFR